MALLAPQPEYFYRQFPNSTLDSHLDLMRSISSNPEVLDLIDDHLQGQLWEDVKEFISANPDILDRLDGQTLAGLKDWWHKAKEKARHVYHYMTGKNKDKKKTETDEASDEEQGDDQPAAATASTRFGTTIRGCRTVSPADLTHLKLRIMQDPDVLDEMNAHLRDGLWQAMKGVIAADPALIHHLPCMVGGMWDKLKNAANHVYNGAKNMLYDHKHKDHLKSHEEIEKEIAEHEKQRAENEKTNELRKKLEEARKNAAKSKKYTRSPFQPDTIGIRVPVYGGDGRLSASMLERYAPH